jgi:hypothetical protein
VLILLTIAIASAGDVGLPQEEPAGTCTGARLTASAGTRHQQAASRLGQTFSIANPNAQQPALPSAAFQIGVIALFPGTIFLPPMPRRNPPWPVSDK